MVHDLLAFIPSPSSGSIHIGPLRLNGYGMFIALGMFVAVWLTDRRWRAVGGEANDIGVIATWALPAGVIGARMYHVATDWKSFRGRWLEVFFIWQGGLGIWGGVALGALAGVYIGRRRGMDVRRILDAAAPAIPFAQAIGRWGNWINVELFGKPTTLPWALEVPPQKRPPGFEAVSTFHPTFLYESLWNVFVGVMVLWVHKRFGDRFKPGRMFAVYVAGYTFGRFFIERIRIDTASRLLGLRFNEWTAAVVFIAALIVLTTGRKAKSDSTSGEPGPVPNRPVGLDERV